VIGLNRLNCRELPRHPLSASHRLLSWHGVSFNKMLSFISPTLAVTCSTSPVGSTHTSRTARAPHERETRLCSGQPHLEPHTPRWAGSPLCISVIPRPPSSFGTSLPTYLHDLGIGLL
jgi:hypothetical protein